MIKVGDEYRAIRSNGMKDEQKRVDDENKKALDEWKDAVKSDPKAERPARLVIRRIKTGFLTQKGADEFIAKLVEEDDAKGGKSKAKK